MISALTGSDIRDKRAECQEPGAEAELLLEISN